MSPFRKTMWHAALFLGGVGAWSCHRSVAPGSRVNETPFQTLAEVCPQPDAATPAPEGFAEGLRIGVIGDYGYSGAPEEDVANLLERLGVSSVITTGDNNYPAGSIATIDENIGRYYHRFIGDYRGRFGCRPPSNRFFPSLGNHDWVAPGAAPYLAYFSLPGNERYYDFVEGSVHFFALDSDPGEPDGITADSPQGLWLKNKLAASTDKWRIVYMHHPPYSSGPHASQANMQWPFKAWGVDLVLSGHDHDYERITVDGMTYIVCGLGGASIYTFGEAVDGSTSRFGDAFGAGVLDADATRLRFRFYATTGQVVDEVSIPPQR